MTQPSPFYLPSLPQIRFDTDPRANPRAKPQANPQARRVAAQPVLAGPAASAGPAPSVKSAIADAARRTSVDFEFLIAQAQVESSMDPHARARTSSATGLYQFIESTWLETMQRHGGRFGLGDVASQISSDARGRARVADPAQRSAILAMRSDPQTAAFMAAGLAEDNRAHLTPILGRQPDHSELYLAHFLGAGGAGRFLSAMADNPDQSAASLFARPAAANRAIFYERGGHPRSLAGVMNVLDSKMERAVIQAEEAQAAGRNPATAITAQTPYSIANGAASAPVNAAAITMRGRRSLSASLSAPPVPSRPPAGSASRLPISNVLRDTFGAGGGTGGGGSDQSAVKIERAYKQFRAFGL